VSGPAIEILGVELSPLDDLLVGRHVDLPKAGMSVAGPYVQLVGWAAGREGPVDAVEFACDGRILDRVAVDSERPDLAEAFPTVEWAGRSGFRGVVGLLGGGETFLELRAIADGRRVPIAAILACRAHADETAGDTAALVSIVVVAGSAADVEEAVASALAQTYPGVEVVVAAVAPGRLARRLERFAGIRVVKAPAGVAAARNAGLEACAGGYVVFLDARDRLRPDALEAGLRQLAAHPDWAFAAGLAEVISPPGKPELAQQPVVGGDHYAALLREGFVLNHAAVMYRRAALAALGGFDEELALLSEYDLCLRIAREQPVGSHVGRVVEDHSYTRRHEWAADALETGLEILDRQREHVAGDPRLELELERGIAAWHARWQPLVPVEATSTGGGLHTVARGIGLLRGPSVPTLSGNGVPEPGRVDLGDLRRLTPISRKFGYDRGLPVDRHYVEGFLARHADDVRGRVLEVQESDYTARFGGDAVRRSDVLSLRADNPAATIVGDLTSPLTLPESTFDCVILTQTLQLVYDIRAAVESLYRSLGPAGVLLVTVPGISPVEWGETWHWSFTALSLRRLLEDVFGLGNVDVESHGNVLAATAFLHGLACEELDADELDAGDSCYPLILTARAVRSGWAPRTTFPAGSGR
jgi:SAM-dependent methyltransferase